MIPKSKRYEIACDVFLKNNSSIQNELDTLNPEIAEALGVTLDTYRKTELAKYLNSYAKSQGKNLAELIIDLCASTREERKEMYIEHHKEVAEALGIE